MGFFDRSSSSYSRSNTQGHRSSSYYKRSPRKGYISRLVQKLRRMLRELIYYAKKHPIKVFMLVIMPLLTGGGLLTLLKRFGIPLPPEIGRLVGGLAKSGGEGGGIAGYAAKAATLGTGLGSAATIIKAVQAFM